MTWANIMFWSGFSGETFRFIQYHLRFTNEILFFFFYEVILEKETFW